jgi:glutathione S-transferase
MRQAQITLYGTPPSGHAHRVELLLRMLELPYSYIEAPAAVRNTAEFLRLNPLGQIPVLTDGELILCDSAAIMVYLVKKYAPNSTWLPEEAVAAAQVQRWLAIAAGEVRYGPALARAITHFGYRGDLTIAREIAHTLLSFMNVYLTGRRFLALNQPTLADLACYSYIAHASEGGISLAEYLQVRAWLAEVEALPHFKAMPVLPLA